MIERCLRMGLGFLFLSVAGISVDRAAAADPERLSIAYCVDCVPFHFQDETGAPAGLLIDYWHLWSEKTGIALDFVAAPWDETLRLVGEGAVDAHAGLFYNEERDRFLDYGVAMRESDTHVFFHRSIPATTQFHELAAYRIGVISDDYVEGFLSARVPGGTIHGYLDYDAMFAALEAGELKVFAADTPTGLFHLKRTGLLADFTFVAGGPLYRNDWFVAAQEGDADTVELVNRGMGLITEAETREIGRRWIGETRDAAKDDALIIAIDRGYAPFTFLNAQGRPAGLFVDLWQAWAERTGHAIRFRPSNWSETVRGLQAGEVDIHSGLSFSAQRSETVDFSQQIYQTASRIYHRADDTIPANIGAFDDRVLGVETESFQAAEVGRLYRDIHLQSFPTTAMMVNALIDGEIDAALQDDLVMDQRLRDMGLQGDIVARPERLFVSTIHAGVGKDRGDLLADINDGLDLLSGGELAALEARWLTDPDTRFFGRGMTDFEIGLTRAERAWLNAHPVIRLGVDRAWMPYEYLDEQGVHRGLSAAVVGRIEQILGITLQAPPSLAWSETIDRIRTGGLDVVAAVAPTTEREEYLAFTLPYMTWPNVIATRADARPVGDIMDLDGRRVGVVSGYAIQDILADLHLDIELVPQPDIPDGLRALSDSRIDAFVDSPLTVGYFKDQLQLDDIAIVAQTPYKLEVALGVRNDWPELAVILDKALAQISAAERQALLAEAGLPTDISITRPTQRNSDIFTLAEASILVGVVGAVVALILALTWTIRSQRRPLLQSLRGKSIVFIGGVFLLVGGATIWAFLFVGDRISAQLGLYVAERHVLWHKERVLGAVGRELALAKQMAESEILMRWSQDEASPSTAADARRELQAYHDNFTTSTYFVGLAKSGHFFYADDQTDEITLNVLDTLSRDDIDDSWFFATIEDSAPYNLNVDHNSELGVTKLWVNYAMRRGSDTFGVVGTGVQLTDFINSFLALETKGVTAMMIDNNGAVQAHVDQSKIAQNVIGTDGGDGGGIWDLLSTETDRNNLRRHMANLQSGASTAETFFLDFDGTNQLMAMSYLEPLGWYTLAAFEPGSVVGISEMGPLTAVLGMALLITLVVFVIGQNVLIIRPLNRLSAGAQSLSGGNYDISLDIRQRDEIGDLTQTFNDMAAMISDATRTLETRVAERTAELQQKQDELATKEDQLRIALDNMPGGMFMIDSELNFVLSNDRYRDLFDFPEGLLADGRPLTDMFRFQAERGDYGDGEVADQISGMVDRFTAGDQTRYERRLSNGRVLEVQVAPTPEGGTVAVASDITMRKRAEEQIRAGERNLQRILDTSPVGIAISSRDASRRLYVNTTFVQQLGANSTEELMSMNMADSYVDRAEFDLLQKALGAGERMPGREIQRRRIDGSAWWCLTEWNQIEFQGEPAHIVWHYDVSEQRRAADEVARKEAQLRVALDHMSDGMFALDSDLCYVLYNDQYKTLIDVPDHLVAVGHSFEDVLESQMKRGDFSAEAAANLIADYKSGKPTIYEREVESGRILEFKRSPTNDGGVVAVISDITKRKRAEAELADSMTLVSSSIEYASRIQRSILPESRILDRFVSDHFVIWEPRDVVGGDLFWVREERTGCMLILLDCTGHGVPGALMTTIANGAIEQAFSETADPARLVANVNRRVKTALKQDGRLGDADDGMEMGVCLIEPDRRRLVFAGSGIPLLQVGNGASQIISGERCGCGYRRVPMDQRYTNHTIHLDPGMSFYMFSDGFVDQVGGDRRRSFGKKRLTTAIMEQVSAPMDRQQQAVMNRFAAHQGGETRRDDIAMIGFRAIS